MTISVHKTDLSNRTQTLRFYPSNFTGKERDEETGFGYFGARYMDHELTTMWLSVDPLADKYSSISPYAYCAWNPVKLVDPDGREIDVSAIFDENGNARKDCEIAAKALMAFANSKFGHRALSLFAKKGDKVGNVSFDKDGLFHEKGIDLSFNVATLKDCGGETGHKLTGSGKSKRLMLSVNLDTPVCGSDKDNIIRSLETICHEMFFHVFNYANDFDDDQNLNNSEISEYYRKECASDLNAMQEYHDLYVTHRYRDFAIPIMQEHLNSTREEAIATLNRTRGINMRNCPNWHKK